MTRARDLAAFVSNADGDIKFDTDTLFVDSSANRVGISTDTPSEKLEIDGGSAAGYLKVTNDASTEGIEIGIAAVGDGIVNVQDAAPLRLFTNDTERMRINDSGNVGVGTTSPSYALSVAKTTTGTHAIDAVNNTTGAGSTRLILRNPSSDTNGNGFQIINNANDGVVNLLNYKNTDLALWTNATERMRILSSGGLTFNGDTAAANALDDYEEGTWTPSLSTGFTLTTNRGCTYTKIGRLVYITANLSMTGTSSSGSQLEISGLPFAQTGGNSGRGNAVCWFDRFACGHDDGIPIGAIYNNETLIRHFVTLSNTIANQISLTAGMVTTATTSEYQINIQYYAA